jgi:hypothetical protein
LFSIYFNDVVVSCENLFCGEILVYADDVLIIARSVCTLQLMFDVEQNEITSCNMTLNVSKYCALRVGPRFHASPLLLDWIYHG